MASRSLEFHRGNPQLLNLTWEQSQQLNDILSAADHDYVTIEAQHQQRKVDPAGNLTVTVLPFAEEVKTLEDRVWRKLEAVLSPQQLRTVNWKRSNAVVVRKLLRTGKSALRWQ